jgi:hypothetical protein
MAHISAEISAEDVLDLMNENGEFMKDMLVGMAERINMGMLRDNASDLASNMSPEKVKFLAAHFKDLGEAMVSGYKMSNLQDLEM